MASYSWKTNAAVAYPLGLARGLFLFSKYRHRTMIPGRQYAENLALISLVLRNPDLDGGSIIECGTWRGGMSAGMIEAAGIHRSYHFFDSFEGLPPADERDGEHGKEFQRNTSSPTYYDNCRASLEEFEQTIAITGCPVKNIGIHKGFFDSTLPGFSCPPIAVLRLDADLYASTMICLEKFWDHVLPGGLILIDDYYAWEGCSSAVHVFLVERASKEHIRQGPIGRVAFIIKNA
jgi:O-methyltransferase